MKHTAADLWLQKLEKTAPLEALDARKRITDLAITYESDTLNLMSEYRGEREIAVEYMENRFGFRQNDDPSNIFNKSNETMGLLRSGITFITARTQEDIFGSSPWFAAQPQGGADGDLAEKLQKHAAWKLEQAGYNKMGEDVVERVFHLGDAILRAGWRKDTQQYTRLAAVLCTGTGAKLAPVITPDGDYIYPHDAQQEMQKLDDGTLADIPAPTDAPPDALPVPDTAERVNVFAKAAGMEIPADAHFADWLIEESRTTYNGLDVVNIDWRNWRCDTSYAKVEDAPFRGHVYEMRYSQLRAKMVELHGEEWDDELRETMDLAKAGDSGARDEARRNGTHSGSGDRTDPKNPNILCLDFEMEWDPLGDGDTRLFFGTVLLEHQRLVFLDFMANMLPDGVTLYSVVSAYNPLNRWAGRGWWKLFEDVVKNSDALWNSIIWRDAMISNPMTGVHWDAIEEDENEIQFLPGACVTLEKNKRMSDFLEVFAMPNLDRGTWELLEFFMKLNQLETGVTSAAQGGLGDLPATNTATGIQSVLSSGSTLHKRPANDIRKGLEDNLGKALTLIYSLQDKAETFRYGEGQNAVLVEMTPEDVRDLRLNVKILMTRFKQRELVENSRAAIMSLTQYLSLPEPEKATARSLFVQLLKGLDIQNAEEIIRQPVELPPPGPPPPSESININYRDLPPSAKASLLKDAGVEFDPQELTAQAEAAPTSNAQ